MSISISREFKYVLFFISIIAFLIFLVFIVSLFVASETKGKPASVPAPSVHGDWNAFDRLSCDQLNEQRMNMGTIEWRIYISDLMLLKECRI